MMIYIKKLNRIHYDIRQMLRIDYILSIGRIFMLLEDVLKEFLFHLETKNYSVRTTKGYRNNIKVFLKYATIEYEIHKLSSLF